MTARTRSTVALCVVCFDRPDELRDLLDSTSGASFDEVVVVDMASTPELPRQAEVATWVRLEANEGCPAGRNYLAGLAASDILLFVDDDAVLIGEEDAATVLRELFDADERLGAVAGRIERKGGRIERSEFPFLGRPRAVSTQRRAGYHVGACVAVRRTAFNEVGGYDGDYFYSTEEIDLSTRLHRAGWRSLYSPRVRIEHRPSSSGRSPSAEVLTMRLRNRLLYCRRNLPWPVALVHSAVWAGALGVDALKARQPGAWFDAWRPGLTKPVRRDPLTWSQARELQRVGGRVWW